jgi:hypothetical protein
MLQHIAMPERTGSRGPELPDPEGLDEGGGEISPEALAERARLRREALRRAREMPSGKVVPPGGEKR